MGKRRTQIMRQEKRRQSHKILNDAAIPRRQDGNRLGVRKRVALVRKKIEGVVEINFPARPSQDNYRVGPVDQAAADLAYLHRRIPVDTTKD